MSASSQILVFDRVLVRRHRDRAASRFAAHSVLNDEAASHLIERLGDVKRNFTSVLVLGAGGESLARQFSGLVVKADISEWMVQQARHGSGGELPPLTPPARGGGHASPGSNQHSIVLDEEYFPFAVNSFDLIVCNLNLHWVNDLPGALAQIKQALKPDGLFLAAILGGNTLRELRGCLLQAELAVTGGASPRLSPSIDLLAASGLLQRAGFSLPVADQETVMLTYPDALALMRDLRGMGETNAHLHRLRVFTRRMVLEEAARLYAARHGDADGRIPATFEVIFMHGWKS